VYAGNAEEFGKGGGEEYGGRGGSCDSENIRILAKKEEGGTAAGNEGGKGESRVGTT